MPGKEIERERIAPAAREEIRDKCRRLEDTAGERAGMADTRSADFKSRKFALDPSRSRGIEAKVILIAAGPHRGAILGLVPNFPVTNSIAKSIGPAVVIMPDDPEADLSPPFRVFGRVNEAFGVRVLNAFAQAIDDLHPGGQDTLQILVREREVVRVRVGRVGGRVPKDGVNIDHVGGRPLAIVQASEGNVQGAKLLDETDGAPGGKPTFVDRMQRAKHTIRTSQIDFDNVLLRSRGRWESDACASESHANEPAHPQPQIHDEIQGNRAVCPKNIFC